MTYRLISITQAQAALWLGKTTRQRNIKPTVVKRYAEDMRRGRWMPDVAPAILITDDETVVDGQHRLLALLQQDPGFKLLAEVRTVSADSIVVIDTGWGRNLADTLHILGYDNPKEVSATFYQSFRWARPSLAGKETSRTVQVAMIGDNPNIQFAALVAHERKSVRLTGLRIPSGVIGSLWDIAQYGEGGEEVEAFVDLMHAGRYDTADLLRRFAGHVSKAKNPRSRTSMTPGQVALLTVRVYVGWLTDDPPAKLFARRSALHLLPGFSVWAEKVYGVNPGDDEGDTQ